MRIARTVVMLALVVLLMVAVGCSHKIKLVVSNATNTAMMASVSGGGLGQKSLGVVPANNLIEQKLKFKKKNLPATITVIVGNYSKTFTVRKNGPKRYAVDVTIHKIIRLREGEAEATDELTTDVKLPLGDPYEVIE